MVCHNFISAGLFTLTVSTFVSVSACAVLLVGCCIVYTYEYDYDV